MSIKSLSPKIRLCLTILLCLIWFATCFCVIKVYFFDSTAPLTSENTHQIIVSGDDVTFNVEKVTRIRAKKELLHIYEKDKNGNIAHYFVRWWVPSRKETQEGAVYDVLPKLKEESTLILTLVGKGRFVSSEWEFEVVDVRSATTVYHDSIIESNQRKRDRVIVLLVIWVPVLLWLSGMCLIFRKFLPPEYRGGLFRKIEDLLEKPIGGSRRKDKTIVPPEKPQKGKRTPSEGALFRDEEE